jgi:hypothetical protein
MTRATIILLLCLFCVSFAPADEHKISYVKNKVFVDNKLYCLLDETKAGSKSFSVAAPDGETLIIANVKVEGRLKEGEVDNYYQVMFVPSARDVKIKYDKRFRADFIKALVRYEVFQNGVWNEYGANMLYEELALSDRAIIEPAQAGVFKNDELTEKIQKANIRVDSARYIYINDTLAYTYSGRSNWARGYRYKKGIEGTYYYIKSKDDKLKAEIRIGDHRSSLTKNIRLIKMPEQKMFYFTNVKGDDEKTLITTAIKLLLISN